MAPGPARRLRTLLKASPAMYRNITHARTADCLLLVIYSLTPHPVYSCAFCALLRLVCFPMKVLRFDSVGGASGDMVLASLIGLGVDLDKLVEQLRTLGIGRFEIVPKPVSDGGLSGIRVSVNVPHGDHHPHRRLDDIRQLIRASGLPDRTKALSIAAFERLAEAEAMVHGKSVDEVHFHEVGAMDSIIDVVGSCAALEMLDVSAVTVGPLPFGCGSFKTAHGVMPNPAPATAELLKGHPVVQTDEPFELVTPTGAALLMVWKGTEVGGRKSEVGSRKMAVMGQANAFGHRTLNGRPNLLRAILLETTGQGPVTKDDCLVLESNIDDTNPELIGALTQKLMDQGAFDVFTTAIQMKKQRPGVLLTVLCRPDDRDKLVDLIFAESTTFGIREYLTQRTILERRHVEVETPYGRVRVKIGSWKARDITRSPEHDDCARCAKAHNVPLRAVYEAALRAGA